MFEPTKSEVEQDVEASINLFKRALSGTVAAVTPRRPQHVLLCLDGSGQDATTEQVGRELRERFESQLRVVDARDWLDDEPPPENGSLAEQVAARVESEPVAKTQGDSFQQILDATVAGPCDLIVVPCPFGRELESVGADSAGTVIDVLLARSPAPLLVIRKPIQGEPGQLFQKMRFVLIGENEAAPEAACWATGLIPNGGTLRLALILEHEFYQNVKSLLEAIDPEVEVTEEMLSGALAQTQMRLHRGLQKAAAEQGFTYDLDVLRDRDPRVLALREESAGLLLILALERADHSSQGHVQDRIRQSPHPVFVVPVG